MERVAMVTGASSGLGRGLSLALARDGWRVGLLARRQALLDEVAAEVRELGGAALPLPVDVSDREALHAALRKGEAELGPTDLLIANAGIAERRAGPGSVDGERARILFGVNVLGTAYAVEAVLPGMLERRRGHVVGVSSIAGFRGLPTAPFYSASKAAMSAFLEGLRADLGGSGVAVTVVHPGYVRTPMTAGNRHRMPWIMDEDDAVRVMMRAIRQRRRSVAFPLRTAWLMRLLRFLPPFAWDALTARAARRKWASRGGPVPEV